MVCRTHPCLVVGRGHRMGDRLRGPPVVWDHGRTGDAGRTVLRHPGHGSLERVQLVAHAVAAGMLSTSAARL